LKSRLNAFFGPVLTNEDYFLRKKTTEAFDGVRTQD